MYYEARQFANFYDFLTTLDCCNTTSENLITEETAFEQSEQREIAAFICQQTKERLQLKKGYIRILYVLQGEVELEIGEELTTYGQGCLILVNQACSVAYRLAQDAVTLHFYFKASYFTESLLTQFVEEPLLYRFFVEALSMEFQLTSRFYIFSFQHQPDVHFYALLLLKQIVKMRYFNNKLTKSAFVLFIVEISQSAELALLKRDGYISSECLINEVLAYIELNLATVTLNQIAKKFHFHPNYLSHFVKVKTGQTFTALMLEKRIKLAQKYLVETELSIQEIIERLGYKDKAFFYKRFKEVVGMTPNNYRKTIKEG
ncbi:helix-turn-helix domain-containing protein [Enterococcus sp. CSURQ0835]|uniref:helix-turn-helix domain-containing protein n=1 Tax=Enterococcus sp. CSURQ0835 TaxID=2681394 RepID=UPI001357579E|nr:helix-turn-helix domain-containing protein [Enterococcus sp. CSURQ0835]